MLWSGRPYGGLYWRPGDARLTGALLGGGALSVAMLAGSGATWGNTDVLALLLPILGYLAVGRFYTDARLRRCLFYVLSADGLAIWQDGEDRPRCQLPLYRLIDVRLRRVDAAGRGSIELPTIPRYFHLGHPDDLDLYVPAHDPCRRLELIDDAAAVAELIRAAAQAAIKARSLAS